MRRGGEHGYGFLVLGCGRVQGLFGPGGMATLTDPAICKRSRE